MYRRQQISHQISKWCAFAYREAKRMTKDEYLDIRKSYIMFITYVNMLCMHHIHAYICVLYVCTHNVCILLLGTCICYMRHALCGCTMYVMYMHCRYVYTCGYSACIHCIYCMAIYYIVPNVYMYDIDKML